MSPFQFNQTGSKITFGSGCRRDIIRLADSVGARRIALVVDPHFAKALLGDALTEALQTNDRTVAKHVVPDNEPTTWSIDACHKCLEEFEPDMVVAIGGGSTMDTAKVARIRLANDATYEALGQSELVPHDSMFACMPTTAGTGAEVSPVAVFGDDDREIKLRVTASTLIPHHIVLDPELITSLPANVTAVTGIDALSHAIEAYVSRQASPISDALAKEAISLLVHAVPICFEQPDNIDARGQCLVAATLAGMAFSSARLGLAHAIAAPLGAQHNIVHGQAIALALPAVIAFSEPVLGAKGRHLACAFNARSPAAGIARFANSLNLDKGLDSFVHSTTARDDIAAAAMQSNNLRSAPLTPTEKDMRDILDSMRRPQSSGLSKT